MLATILVVVPIFGVFSNQEPPLVKTPLGQIRGYHRTSHGGRTFSAFEGIPYAKPPIGERRFEEPEPFGPWIGVWNGSFPTICAQTDMYQPNKTTGSEDCLHINVYVPHTDPNPAEQLDVIIHIHGGAYMYESGHVFAPPTLLMDLDVILVTFNYRLGVLGFLSTEDGVVPGNNGLKDQTLALEWVRNNVASFGGNPESVTITGFSAGGASVHFHYLSRLSRGLFHRGMAQSGVALNTWAIQKEPLMRAKKMADAVGCPTTSNRPMVDCLRQRPYKHLLDKIPLFFDYGCLPFVPFGPVIEKGGSRPFLDTDPFYLLRNGQVFDVPLIVTMTPHEGLAAVLVFIEDIDNVDTQWEKLAPTLLEFNYTLAPSLWNSTAKKIKKFYLGDEPFKQNVQKVVQMFSERLLISGVEMAIKLHTKVNKSPVYFYIFGYHGDNDSKWVGHGADMNYYFGHLTPSELKMKELLLDMLNSYARTGKPSLGDVDWKPSGYNELTYLEINGVEPGQIQLKNTKELMSSRKFWKSLNFLEGDNLFFVKNEL